MKDRKNAVLAAIDDNWRQFRTSLDRLRSEDMHVSCKCPRRHVGERHHRARNQLGVGIGQLVGQENDRTRRRY